MNDYFFTATVGREATWIRALFNFQQAIELLACVAQRVGAVAGRSDRVISDLVFTIIT
jgi:hypothetical protein